MCLNKDTGKHQWFTNGLRNVCHKKNKLYKYVFEKKTHESELEYENYKIKVEVQ